MAQVLGLNAKLWYAEPAETPAWVVLGNVKNVTLSLESAEADVTVRANSGWRATVPTLKDASIEWEMVYDDTDAGFTAVRSAFLDNTDLMLKVLDGGVTHTAGNGLRATVRITNFSISQGLEEAVTVSVTAKPTYGTVAPEWQTAEAPAP